MHNPNSRNGRTSPARKAALEALTRIQQDRAYSNLVLNRILDKFKLSRKDASLATEIVYGTLQRQNTIDYHLNRFLSKGTDKLQPWVLCLLRMSFYQLCYLQRIPDHAAVNEAVGLARMKGHRGIAGLVNGVLRSVLREQDPLRLPDNIGAAERISLEHSHPLWLVERWIGQFGSETAERICAANNEPPPASIRVNRLRHGRDEYVSRLRERGMKAEPSVISPWGIRMTGAGNAAADPGFARGEFTVQDESSMLVAESVAPEPGMTVLDACAAPGGKTTHLAEIMQDRGRVYANDLHPHKERLIADQARRLGLDCIETMTGDALRLKDRFPERRFDRILLDAPCSGLGVIRRKPDLKWFKRAEDIAGISALQRELLDTLGGLLRPGGKIVYSTCTLEPSENERVIEHFLANRDDFEIDPGLTDHLTPEVRKKCVISAGMIRVLPSDFGSDGFFIARMRRTC